MGANEKVQAAISDRALRALGKLHTVESRLPSLVVCDYCQTHWPCHTIKFVASEKKKRGIK